VAEDKGGPPLPRRAPGTKRGPGTGPLTRPVLSDSDLRRIRAALDSAQAQAPAPLAERPAPLPRRARRASNGSEPPAPTARPELPTSLLPSRRKKAPTEPPPAVPAPRPGAVTEETRRQPDVTDQLEPATAAAAGPELVPAQRAPAEEREERQDHPDEEKASLEQETASRAPETVSREEVPAGPKNGQVGLKKAQLHGTRALARRPKPAAQEIPPSPPQPTPPKSVPPTAPASPPAPARPRKRGRGRAIITGSAIATLVLLSAGSALLLTHHARTAKARTDASTEVAVRDRAAAWVASQVGRAGLVSCDQAMCRALQARGVPVSDLLVLKSGGVGPLRSAVVVVTAAVRKMVGSRLLTADAPAAIASFGSGAGRISIRVIFPRGAAAYATALRKEIANRKTAGSSLLLLGPVTASAVARQELQGGQVDSRLLLTLAELASQWPVTIMAFGDRAPGASPGIPFRSADLVVTGAKAGLAPVGQVRLMSDFVHQLGDYFTSAYIQTVRLADGQDAVRIAFTAPGWFGLLGTSAR
jgi:hypothetical protein